MKKRKLTMTSILLILYCLFLVWIILFKLSFSATELHALIGVKSINLIPFHYEDAVSTRLHLSEVLNNLLIFIPFGLYLKMLGVSNKKNILCAFAFSLLMESCQFAFRMGAADITDLLGNTLGAVLGVYAYAALCKLCKSKQRLDKTLRILSLIATTIFVLALFILLIANA